MPPALSLAGTVRADARSADAAAWPLLPPPPPPTQTTAPAAPPHTASWVGFDHRPPLAPAAAPATTTKAVSAADRAPPAVAWGELGVDGRPLSPAATSSGTSATRSGAGDPALREQAREARHETSGAPPSSGIPQPRYFSAGAGGGGGGGSGGSGGGGGSGATVDRSFKQPAVLPPAPAQGSADGRVSFSALPVRSVDIQAASTHGTGEAVGAPASAEFEMPLAASGRTEDGTADGAAVRSTRQQRGQALVRWLASLGVRVRDEAVFEVSRACTQMWGQPGRAIVATTAACCAQKRTSPEFSNGLLLCDIVARLEHVRGRLPGVQDRPRVRAPRGSSDPCVLSARQRVVSAESRAVSEQHPQGAGGAPESQGTTVAETPPPPARSRGTNPCAAPRPDHAARAPVARGRSSGRRRRRGLRHPVAGTQGVRRRS